MKYKITSEFRTFLKSLRTERKISTFDITCCLGKKSTATYNNIETEGLKNSLKNIELDTIYDLFSCMEYRITEPYNELSYEKKSDYSEFAKSIIQRFKSSIKGCSIKTQPWLIAFELSYVLFEIPDKIKELFSDYTMKKGISFKDFILELNKNKQLQSLRVFKENNTVNILTDIDGNYLSWGVKYSITDEQAKEYSSLDCMPYYMINDLLFNVFFEKNQNKGEVLKAVNSKLRDCGIFVLIDTIKQEDKGITNLPVEKLNTVSQIVDMFNKYAMNNAKAEITLEKILKNMESDNFFELMSLPIFATLIHFSDSKMSELEKEITKKITELL